MSRVGRGAARWHHRWFESGRHGLGLAAGRARPAEFCAVTESRGGNRAWWRRRPGQDGARAGNDRRSSIALDGGAGRRTLRPLRHWRSASSWQAGCAGRDNCLYTFKAGPAGGRRRWPSSRRQRHDGHRGTGLTQQPEHDDRGRGLASLGPARSVAQPLLRLSRRLVQFHRRHRGGSGSPHACRVWWATLAGDQPRLGPSS
jgi:hypothetical protein